MPSFGTNCETQRVSDSVNQAGLWADTTTLWYIVRSVSTADKAPEFEDIKLNLKSKTKTVKEHVKRFKSSLYYELKTTESTRDNLRAVYTKLCLRSLRREQTGQTLKRRVSVYDEVLQRKMRESVLENDDAYFELIDLVLHEEEMDIKHTKRQGGGSKSHEGNGLKALKVHPLITMFQLRIHLRVVEMKNAFDLESLRQLGPEDLGDEELFFSPENTGPVGETLAHSCVLSWNPAEAFDPSWVTNDAFLWDSDVVPECSGVMRLVLWWIYAYGKDVINVPFHKFYYEVADDKEKLSVYEGETLLHMAVARSDLALVKFLLERGADVRARAWGSFFKEGFYGEYPLSFAVRVNNQPILDFFLQRSDRGTNGHPKREKGGGGGEEGCRTSQGANPQMDADLGGNSVLHLCVLNDLPEMYTYLVDRYGVSEFLLNNDNFTPLQLATSLGKLDFFTIIVENRKSVLWKFGDVVEYSNSMTEHESQRTPFTAPSTLEVVVRHDCVGMMANPFIISCLNAKWSRLREWFWMLVALFIFTYIMLVYIISKQLGGNTAASWVEGLTLGCLAFWTLFFLRYAMHLVGNFNETVKTQEIKRPTPRGMRLIWRHVPSGQVAAAVSANWQQAESEAEKRFIYSCRTEVIFEKKARRVFSNLQAAMLDGGYGLLVPFLGASWYSIVYLLVDSSAGVSVVADELIIAQTVAVITGGYFLMFFFATGIEAKSIGLYVHIVSDTIVSVILPFAIVYVVLLLPHISALLIQFLRTEEVAEYGDFWSAAGKMLGIALTGMGYDDLIAGRSAMSYWLTGVEMVVYTLLVYVLLLNLLIAVLSGKIEEIEKNSLLHLRMRKARIVLWLEKMLPSSMCNNMLIGDVLPSNEPFRLLLENVGKRQQARYHCLKIAIRLVEWDSQMVWTCENTVRVKRLLLDACMKTPLYLRNKQSALGPSRNIETLGKTLERFETKYRTDMLRADLPRVILRDSEFGETVLGLSEPTDKEQLKQVLATVEDMAKAERKQHRGDTTGREEIRFEAKNAVHAKCPLWRGGCFVTGGDPRVDVVQSEEAVYVSVALYIPERTIATSSRSWRPEPGKLRSSLSRGRRSARVTVTPGEEISPPRPGQHGAKLAHIASLAQIVERLHLNEFRSNLKKFLIPEIAVKIAERKKMGLSALVPLPSLPRLSFVAFFKEPPERLAGDLLSGENASSPESLAAFDREHRSFETEVGKYKAVTVSVEIVDESIRALPGRDKITKSVSGFKPTGGAEAKADADETRLVQEEMRISNTSSHDTREQRDGLPTASGFVEARRSKQELVSSDVLSLLSEGEIASLRESPIGGIVPTSPNASHSHFSSPTSTAGVHYSASFIVHSASSMQNPLCPSPEGTLE